MGGGGAHVRQHCTQWLIGGGGVSMWQLCCVILGCQHSKRWWSRPVRQRGLLGAGSEQCLVPDDHGLAHLCLGARLGWACKEGRREGGSHIAFVLLALGMSQMLYCPNLQPLVLLCTAAQGAVKALEAVRVLLRGAQDDDHVMAALFDALRAGPDPHLLSLDKCTGCKSCGEAYCPCCSLIYRGLHNCVGDEWNKTKGR